MAFAPTGILACIALAAGLAPLPARAHPATASGTALPATAPTASESRLAATYTDWAGSPANAASLIDGLRHGTPITLTASPPSPSGGTLVTTFTSPTKPMGYGNIRIALALARQQLAARGVAQPTPDQLQAALVGGPLTLGSGATARTTELQGVLALRSSGMGWGQVAHSLGYKLGPVMSGKAPASPAPLSAGGITTAAGRPAGTKPGDISHGSAGKGIVTAAGGAMAGGLAGGPGQAGIVTAHGGGAGGQGHGLALGKNGK